jgi:flagellar protein FliS
MKLDTYRDRYISDSVDTASPARLVTMMYDRLVLDLASAEATLLGSSPTEASPALTHAQDIVIELRTALRLDVWSGAAGLASLYSFILRELIAANVSKDATKVAECRKLIEPLRDAWRDAANSTAVTARSA